jgi:TPR repeat protein
MRYITAILISLLIGGSAYAESITNIYGRVYEDARIKDRSPEGINIYHSEGISLLPFDELPDSLREKYGYDRKKFVEYREQKALQQRIEKALGDSALNAEFTAFQVLDDIALARVYELIPREKSWQVKKQFSPGSGREIVGPKPPPSYAWKTRQWTERRAIADVTAIKNINRTMAENEKWKGVIYRIGSYSYTSVAGEDKVVGLYTVDRGQAEEYWKRELGVVADRADKQVTEKYRIIFGASPPSGSMIQVIEKAKAGDTSAKLQLALAYLCGDQMDLDYRRAADLLREVAEDGEGKAQFLLGLLYEDGLGVARSNIEAARWFKKAADNNVAAAQNKMGDLYQYHNKRDSRYAKAAKWYEKSAANGDRSGQFNLAKLYEDGKGVYQDYGKAAELYRASALQNYAPAQVSLGMLYYRGRGVLQDYTEACAWALLAQKNGADSLKKMLDSQLSANYMAAASGRARLIESEISNGEGELASIGNVSGADRSNTVPTGSGSGFLIRGGFVLTCYHVVDGSERLEVLYNNKSYEAAILRQDPGNDIAILKIEDLADGAEFRAAKNMKLGQICFTMGYPRPGLQGSDVKFTSGTISSITSGPDNDPRFFQISVPLQPGNSGGPLFDEHGNFAGMAVAKLSAIAVLELTGSLPENVNYALKSDYILPILKTVEGSQIGNPLLRGNMIDRVSEVKPYTVMIKTY